MAVGMDYRIVDTEARHIGALAERLREGDLAEVRAAGITPQRALWRSWRASHFAKTGFVGNEVACIFGCGGSPAGPVGEPWLLTAPAIERAKLTFVREARIQVLLMMAVWPRLEGRVLASYTKAVRFLRALGFTVEDGGPLVPGGPPFCTYRLGAN